MNFNFFQSKDSYNYIRIVAQLSEYAVQAAEYLDKVVKDFEPEKMPGNIAAMHEIERNADIDKDAMLAKLLTEFLAPIDKDDIVILAHQIDTVTDAIEEVLIFIDIHNVREIRPDVHAFTELIIETCIHMNLALKELENYKKSARLYEQQAVVNRLKAESRRLYGNSLKNLYECNCDPVEKMVYTELYKYLQRCCKKCKKVTNTMERIVIKNL